MKHIRETDLNLLLALFLLVEERSVSRAAERFFLSQPAMSRSLTRLRDAFNDELLVRTSEGYEPTARARQAYAELSEILPRLEALLRGREFNPAEADDHFSIACTDYATSVLGPSLCQTIFNSAPKISLHIKSWHDGAFEDCIKGKLDLVLWVNSAPEPLVSETLFTEDFVCVLSSKHANGSERLTIEDYLAQPHVIVDVLEGKQTLVEEALKALGQERPAGLRIPYFSAALSTIRSTNLIATLPRRLAQLYAASAPYSILESPIELEPFDYIMAWHPRLTHDPAHLWLRDCLRRSTQSSSIA